MTSSRRYVVVYLLFYVLVFSLLSAYAQDEGTPAEIHADDMVVVNTTEIDLIAGPANTAAYLAPDGSQFAYLADHEICFYALPEVEETSCIEMPENSRPLADTIKWSPEGRYLVMQNNDFLRMFLEPDLLLVDTQEGTLTNVTDDGVDGSIFGEDLDETVQIDLAPQWVTEEGFAFLRYETDGDDFSPANIYSYDIASGQAQSFGEIPQSQGRLDVYLFDVEAATEQYAFYLDQRSDNLYGIFLSENEAFPRSIAGATSPESRYAGIGLISISPDGQYLLNYDIRALSMGASMWTDINNSVAQALDIETSEGVLIDDAHFVTQAGWSPQGHGLVYVVNSLEDNGESGLYITSAPGEPGHMLLSFDELDVQAMAGTTPYRQQPIMWASNNTILVSVFPEGKLLLIELGAES
ncbi:hypothetical protein G4Y79_01080 [Phototrophicus methaneseepsis]|uniref:WD40 repeat domain-containing protein n=1 Tax=Phototrophicus methaneseepsis TaxID=2710758 RepID=A0A7S8E9Z8_9CHLR|nr:hypothetical protein [Phototrophicus methaneseepsis]QPC82999.1 hypothetical protein G4Y79_01080 [Phototrophicus methaneseepsis]